MDPELNQNAGAAGQGFSPSADQGAGGANSGQPSNPAGASGHPTAQGQDDLSRYKAEVQRLNRALIEAKRGSRQPGFDPNGEDPYSTPQGQYALALQVATGNLRAGLENIAELYPEVDGKVISQIRKNPWAFASQQSYFQGDVESALLEIETYLSQVVESAGAGANGGGNQPPTPPAKPTPANISGNPAPEPGQGAGQGEDEDQDPWTMPMDQLEAAAAKAKRKLQAQG